MQKTIELSKHMQIEPCVTQSSDIKYKHCENISFQETVQQMFSFTLPRKLLRQISSQEHAKNNRAIKTYTNRAMCDAIERDINTNTAKTFRFKRQFNK